MSERKGSACRFCFCVGLCNLPPNIGVCVFTRSAISATSGKWKIIFYFFWKLLRTSPRLSVLHWIFGSSNFTEADKTNWRNFFLEMKICFSKSASVCDHKVISFEVRRRLKRNFYGQFGFHGWKSPFCSSFALVFRTSQRRTKLRKNLSRWKVVFRKL